MAKKNIIISVEKTKNDEIKATLNCDVKDLYWITLHFMDTISANKGIDRNELLDSMKEMEKPKSEK